MIEVRSQASNLQPPTSNTPIIAMTAHAMSGDEQKSLDAGIDDHVTKPIDPDQLFATLQKWIKPSAERTAAQMPPLPDIPPEPDRAAPDEDELSESLPGFDLAAGLKRLRGNKRLYRKLLPDFGANYVYRTRRLKRTKELANDWKIIPKMFHRIFAQPACWISLTAES
jgi:hypothetical protein